MCYTSRRHQLTEVLTDVCSTVAKIQVFYLTTDKLHVVFTGSVNIRSPCKQNKATWFYWVTDSCSSTVSKVNEVQKCTNNWIWLVNNVGREMREIYIWYSWQCVVFNRTLQTFIFDTTDATTIIELQPLNTYTVNK